MMKLNARISKVDLRGRANIVPSEGGASGNYQVKTIYPSHEYRIIRPDEDFDALAYVQVVEVPKIKAVAANVALRTGVDVNIPICNMAAVSGVRVEDYHLFFLYNGVRLPRIPDSLLEQYPYCFIRNNTTSGYYEMYCSVSPYYYSSSDAQIQFTDSTARQRYRIAIASAETATAWEGNGTSTANVSIDSTKPVLWSSRDIPNGSADATDIYFAATEPVPTT